MLKNEEMFSGNAGLPWTWTGYQRKKAKFGVVIVFTALSLKLPANPLEFQHASGLASPITVALDVPLTLPALLHNSFHKMALRH